MSRLEKPISDSARGGQGTASTQYRLLQWGKDRFSVRSGGLIVPLAALWLGLAIIAPNFLTVANMLNILIQVAVVGVLAFGSTIVLITEEIDLSIGAVEGLAAVVAGIVIVNIGAPWPMGVAAAIAGGCVVGLLNGLFTVGLGIPSFIVTLATMGIASGVSLQATAGETIYGFPKAYLGIGGRIFGIPVPIVIAFCVLLTLQFVLQKTRFGLNCFAVGSNSRASVLAGISPKRVKLAALVISGGCAGVAGVIVSAQLGAANGGYGSADLLYAIAAVVIGGTALTGGVGSVIGTGLGVLVIATMSNGLALLNVSPYWQIAAVGAIILAAAIADRLVRTQRMGG